MRTSRFQLETLVFGRFKLLRALAVHGAQFELWAVRNEETDTGSLLLFLPPGVSLGTEPERRFSEWLAGAVTERDVQGRAGAMRPLDLHIGSEIAFELEMPPGDLITLADMDRDAIEHSALCRSLAQALQEVHSRRQAQGYFDESLVLLRDARDPLFLPRGLVQCVLDELFRLDPDHVFFISLKREWTPGTVRNDTFLFAAMLSRLPMDLPRDTEALVRRTLSGEPIAIAGFAAIDGAPPVAGFAEKAMAISKALEPSSAYRAPNPDSGDAERTDAKAAGVSLRPTDRRLMIATGAALALIAVIVAIATRKPHGRGDERGALADADYSIPDDWFVETDQLSDSPEALDEGDGVSEESVSETADPHPAGDSDPEPEAVPPLLVGNEERPPGMQVPKKPSDRESGSRTEASKAPTRPMDAIDPTGAAESNGRPEKAEILSTVHAPERVPEPEVGLEDRGSDSPTPPVAVDLSAEPREPIGRVASRPAPEVAPRPVESPVTGVRSEPGLAAGERSEQVVKDAPRPSGEAGAMPDSIRETISAIPPPSPGEIPVASLIPAGDLPGGGGVPVDVNSSSHPTGMRKAASREDEPRVEALPSLATNWLPEEKRSPEGTIVGYSSTTVTEADWSRVMGGPASERKADRARFATVWEAEEFLSELTRMDREEGRIPEAFSYRLPGRGLVTTSKLLTREESPAVAKPFTFVVVSGGGGGRAVSPAPESGTRLPGVGKGQDQPLWQRPR